VVVAERVKIVSEVDGGSQGRWVVVAPDLTEVPQGVLVESARDVVVAISPATHVNHLQGNVLRLRRPHAEYRTERTAFSIASYWVATAFKTQITSLCTP
jgi:hypothetical protein